MQSACAECIACAGRLDRCRIKETGFVSFNAVAVCLGAVRTIGSKYKRNLILVDDHLDALVQIGLAGHELDLVVGNLQDVASGKTIGDLLFCFLLGAPERRTKVRVEGDDSAACLCNVKSFNRSCLDAFVCHGKSSEMEDLCILDESLVGDDFVFGEHDVCARIAVEGEISVAVRQFLNKCERCMNFFIHHEACHVDALLDGPGFQHSSEHVVADFAEESSLAALLIQHGENVARCSARVDFQELVALRAQSAFCEVDQKFAEGSNINLLFCAHID